MKLLKPFSLSRRALLRGAGTAMALPWLEVMTNGPRRAQAAVNKKFVTFFTPNGHIRDAWLPKGTETEFVLGRSLKPLEALQSEIVVLDGVDNVCATKGLGDDHMRGMGSMLTGSELMQGKTQGGGGTPAGLANGISIDQELVNKLKPATKLPSMEMGVYSGSQGTVWGYSNYKGPGQALPLDNNPQSIWNRAFSDLGAMAGDNSGFLRQRAQRKSVMDAVAANYRLMVSKVGIEDKKRLEQHLTNVSELEKRVGSSTPPAISKACVKPNDPLKPDYRTSAKYPEIGKLQMDLLVMALQCDITRVATLQWTHSVGDMRMTWIPGVTRGHHDMSHDPDTALDSRESLTLINEWHATQFAHLINKMKMVDEGGVPMLNNSLVLWTNELSKGNAHSHPDMPFVLAGKAGGKLKTGRLLTYDKAPSVPHNNLLVSILNMFDVPATTFGYPAYCTGPLAKL